MLATILALLPKVGPVIASLPEFASLIARIKNSLTDEDQATLEKAYALAQQDSDDAHTELQQLVAQNG